MTAEKNASQNGMEKDPVCGMDVQPSGERTVEYRGRTYHFCSDKCLNKFKNDPEQYLREDKKKQAETAPTGEYTCRPARSWRYAASWIAPSRA